MLFEELKVAKFEIKVPLTQKSLFGLRMKHMNLSITIYTGFACRR